MTDEATKELEAANKGPLNAADLAIMGELRDRIAKELSGSVMVELNAGRIDLFVPLDGDDAGDGIVADYVTIYQIVSRILADWATLDLREGDLRRHMIRRWRPDLLKVSL